MSINGPIQILLHKSKEEHFHACFTIMMSRVYKILFNHIFKAFKVLLKNHHVLSKTCKQRNFFITLL